MTESAGSRSTSPVRIPDLDLVEAVKVALAAEYGTDAVLTRDLRDFRAVRPMGGKYTHFRILPDDL